jgi:hypothetical protein
MLFSNLREDPAENVIIEIVCNKKLRNMRSFLLCENQNYVVDESHR